MGEDTDKGWSYGAWQAYIIFILLGIGNLLPWNAFITASYYFKQRFCNTMFVDNFESYFSLGASFSQSIMLLVVVVYQESMSFFARVEIPFAVQAVCFFLTTIFVVVDAIRYFPITYYYYCYYHYIFVF